jgi:outer membrane protein insertion porin family
MRYLSNCLLVQTLLCVGLSSVLINPARAQEPFPEEKPVQAAPVPGPTGGQLRFGDEEGFGFGTLAPDPTALYGPNRVRPVLPNSGTLSTASLSGYYANNPTPNQRLLFELEGDNSQLGLDLSYSIVPEDWPGRLSANFFVMNGRQQSFEGGPINVGLSDPRGSIPWLHQLGGGLEYSQLLTPDFRLAGALNYRETSVHDSPFGGRVRAFDETGQPLTLGSGGTDQMLSLRMVGLFSTLDSLQFPTDGTKLRFGMEQTIPVGQTQMNSTRLMTSWTQFIPARPFAFDEGPSSLIFNLQAGTMIGDRPAYDAFNLGGVNSVRGWDQGDLATGQSFFQATAEYRFPIGKPSLFGRQMDLRGTFFADYATDFGTAGSVWGKPGLTRGKAGQGAGIGAGLHLYSPVGLIRLESAVSDQGQFQFYLTVGDRY